MCSFHIKGCIIQLIVNRVVCYTAPSWHALIYSYLIKYVMLIYAYMRDCATESTACWLLAYYFYGTNCHVQLTISTTYDWQHRFAAGNPSSQKHGTLAPCLSRRLFLRFNFTFTESRPDFKPLTCSYRKSVDFRGHFTGAVSLRHDKPDRDTSFGWYHLLSDWKVHFSTVTWLV